MKKFKILSKSIYGLITLILLSVAAVTALSAFDIPNGIRLYVVQSGSMEPAIHTGSVVIIKPSQNYKKGDVITFKAEKDKQTSRPKETVTHRINEVKNIDGKISYQTKGDANNSADASLASSTLVLGKVLLAIPFIGFAVNFARTLPGLMVLIVIPATIIIYSEMITIKNETKRLMIERKKRKLTLKENLEEKIGEEIIKTEEAFKKSV